MAGIHSVRGFLQILEGLKGRMDLTGTDGVAAYAQNIMLCFDSGREMVSNQSARLCLARVYLELPSLSGTEQSSCTQKQALQYIAWQMPTALV